MRGIVVGRFQPLHNGHVQLIKRAIEDSVHVTVVIGSADAKVSSRNPFSTEERTAMVRAAFGDAVDVVAVPDIHDPPRYADFVAEQLGGVDRVFGNDESTVDLFEDAGYTVVRPGLIDRENYEGRNIRAWLAEGDQQWRKVVPKGVEQILVDIEASKRLARME